MTRYRLVFAALVGAAVAAPVMAADLSFTLANNSGADLTEFYASPVGVADWQENILDGQTLPAGSSGQVAISDSGDVCDWDLRMVFADGDVLEESGNLCETGSYTIN
ncbi:MAG: hypothetical protein WCC57_15050 [Paracoccaceae bacterium]